MSMKNNNIPIVDAKEISYNEIFFFCLKKNVHIHLFTLHSQGNKKKNV